MDNSTIIFAGGVILGAVLMFGTLFLIVVCIGNSGDIEDLSPDDIANSAEAPSIVGRVGCADRARGPSDLSRFASSPDGADPSRINQSTNEGE